METVWDWIAVVVFACLIVLFLQRSSAEKQVDRVIDYLPPAIGCAASNYLGNEGLLVWAIMAIAGVLIYVWFVLKPFAR